MTTPKLSSQQAQAVATAFTSVRKSLAGAPVFLAAVAIAAGMSSTDARAWGSQYENLGRQIGNEVGRSAVGGGYGSKANLAGMIGQTVGSVLARPIDQSAQERERMARIEQQERESIARAEAQARERAAREAANNRYSNTGYGSAVTNSQRANTTYQAAGNGLTFSNAQGQTITQEQFESGNYPRQR